MCLHLSGLDSFVDHAFGVLAEFDALVVESKFAVTPSRHVPIRRKPPTNRALIYTKHASYLLLGLALFV